MRIPSGGNWLVKDIFLYYFELVEIGWSKIFLYYFEFKIVKENIFDQPISTRRDTHLRGMKLELNNIFQQ